MKKSILNIIEKYNLKEDLKLLLSLENPDNDPDLPPVYKGKEEFVYNSLEYIPKIIKIIKEKTGIELGSPMVCQGTDDDNLDFYWKTDNYSLLANVLEDSGVSYYMMDSKHEKLAEGKLD